MASHSNQWRCMLAVILVGGSVLAQGRTDYFNVETPQVQAISVARIAGYDYLLVCNTPDNSVEIYDTNENLPASSRFLARVPVGLEPCSIVWSGENSRAYVACFLGDSVTSISITAPAGPSSLTAVADHSRNLGDEPMDVELDANESILFVAFNNFSTFGAFDPITLQPVTQSAALPAPTHSILISDATGDRVLKEPRVLAVTGNQVFVLNTKGGRTGVDAPRNYDFDLYARHLTTGDPWTLGGLGTTNMNMRFASDGDLWVVGGFARIELAGAEVSQAATGFVRSELYRVTEPGDPTASVITRDLNATGAGAAVAKAQSLTMPTDLAVYEDGQGPIVVYVAAFGSDRVGAVTIVDPADPSSWTLRRISIPVAPGSANPSSGPRCLALKPAGTDPNDPGDRLYVLNRLDNSVSIVDPASASFVETFALQHDPTPAYIRDGRPFLYGAESSGSGKVSCASCHVDARTDSLGWDLGSPFGSPPSVVTYPLSFFDSPTNVDLRWLYDILEIGFNNDKGVIVTQTLQGLLNHEVAPEAQDLFTNAPYHWRGDRFTFLDFNEGFANLLDLGDKFGTGGLPMGIDPDDMETFEEFINSVHYPPNPKQLETRVYSGDLGDKNDASDGAGAMRGLKIFHITPQDDPAGGGRSCAQCHALAAGSNSKNTVSFANAAGFEQPFETAQLRGLFQREDGFQVDGYDVVPPEEFPPISGRFGLNHNGARGPINVFIDQFADTVDDKEERQDLNQFVHEFDWGSAPMIGRELRVTRSDAGSAPPRISDFEGQARQANVGLAVVGHLSGAPTGYWYDPAADLYVLEGAMPVQTISRANLLALLTLASDRLFFRCTPLGSERRVAAVSGQASPFQSPAAPTSISLLAMETNTAWSEVPELTWNWIPGDPAVVPGAFEWNHVDDPNMPTPRFPRAIRQMQYGLIQATQDYGITGLRHDAPRRFRVAGDGILAGAKLVLWLPHDLNGAPPPPVGSATAPDPTKTRRLELPIFATDDVYESLPVWETAAELSPHVYYALLNGGSYAPGVQAALDDWDASLAEPPVPGTFDPDSYNSNYVEVLNPNGLSGTGGWQRLTLK